MSRVSVILVAAGEGRRFGSVKQFALLRGKPVLDWSVEKFIDHPEVDEIVMVLPDETRKADYLGRSQKVVAVVRGGPRRQDSVRRGLEALNAETADIVLVHDGVRPLLSPALIDRVIRGARRNKAVIPVVSIEETVKEVVPGQIVRTLNRAHLYRAQTPQGFSYSLLKRALQKADEEGYSGTDEAELVERLGEKVAVVEGEAQNLKITTREDLRMAEAWLDA